MISSVYSAKIGVNKAAINTGYGEMRKLSIDPKYLRYIAGQRGGKCALSRRRGGANVPYDFGGVWRDAGFMVKDQILPVLNEALGRTAKVLAARLGTSVFNLVSNPERLVNAMRTYVPRAWGKVKGFFKKLFGKKKTSRKEEKDVADELNYAVYELRQTPRVEEVDDDDDEYYEEIPRPRPRRRRPRITYPDDDGDEYETMEDKQLTLYKPPPAVITSGRGGF